MRHHKNLRKHKTKCNPERTDIRLTGQKEIFETSGFQIPLSAIFLLGIKEDGKRKLDISQMTVTGAEEFINSYSHSYAIICLPLEKSQLI